MWFNTTPSFLVWVYLVFLGSLDWYRGKKLRMRRCSEGKSIWSGDPGHSGNQFVAGRASETFSAKHRKIAAFASEETISNASWSVWHVEGTVAGADGKLGQLVSTISLAA
jgi:hypothetical protein